MEKDAEVIDLTESLIYCPATINFSSSIIELDDSIDLAPASVNSHTPDEPIVIECETDLPEVTIHKKSLPVKKKRKSRNSAAGTSRSSERDRSPQFGYCPICRDPLGTRPMASTKCGHVYCIQCLEQALKIEKKCPTCRKPLKGATAFHPLFL